MSDDHIKGSQKAQNLARIRENQRRSRARRKEYIEELESRLRSCDRLGIEASAELQAAARKVLDENRKLRWLLNMRGVSEPEIAAVLGGPTEDLLGQTSSAPALNMLLERRISSDAALFAMSPSPRTRAASLPRNLHSVMPVPIPAARTTGQSSCDSMSPVSILSSTGTPPSTAYCTPIYTATITAHASEIKPEDVSYDSSYDTYPSSWNYSHNYGYVPEPVAYQNPSNLDTANVSSAIRSDGAPQLVVDFDLPTPIRNYYSRNPFDPSNHSRSYPGV